MKIHIIITHDCYITVCLFHSTRQCDMLPRNCSYPGESVPFLSFNVFLGKFCHIKPIYRVALPTVKYYWSKTVMAFIADRQITQYCFVSDVFVVFLVNIFVMWVVDKWPRKSTFFGKNYFLRKNTNLWSMKTAVSENSSGHSFCHWLHIFFSRFHSTVL